MNWYSSDPHAFHNKVIKYQHRPFKDVVEMTECIAKNINSVVNKRKDKLYVLGDWSFGPRHSPKKQLENATKFRDMIDCERVYLVFGNHDHLKDEDQYGAFSRDFKRLFTKCDHVMEIWDEVVGGKIFLSHYSHRVWNASHHGRPALYGHSHGSLADDPTSLAFDVGVDCFNYFPICSKQVKDILDRKYDWIMKMYGPNFFTRKVD